MRKIDLPEGQSSDSASRTQTSFDRCLVDGDRVLASRGTRNRFRAFGLSFATEAAILAFVILAPLVETVAQPHLVRAVYIPFAPGRPLRAAKPDVRPAPPNRGFRIPGWHFTVAMGAKPSPPARDSRDAESAVEDAGPGPIGDGPAISEFLQPLNPAVPPPVEIRKSAEKLPLKVSEGVVEAQLISRIEPRYPPLALETRTQGTVRLQAIISREGRITSLVVLSGHPLLVQAALDAVRQWRYRPTMLDNEPVEVETTITVVFQLHN